MENTKISNINFKYQTYHEYNLIEKKIKKGEGFTRMPLSQLHQGIYIFFDISWPRFQTARRQTVFSTVPSEYTSTKSTWWKNLPPEDLKEYDVRVCKMVNIYPYFKLIIVENGQLRKIQETIQLSIYYLNNNNTPLSQCRSIQSDHVPLFGESKMIGNEIFTDQLTVDFDQGYIIFKGLKILCLTGNINHKGPFRFGITFTNPKSNLYGQIVYSRPIHVTAKSALSLRSMPKKETLTDEICNSSQLNKKDPIIKNIWAVPRPTGEETVHLWKKITIIPHEKEYNFQPQIIPNLGFLPSLKPHSKVNIPYNLKRKRPLYCHEVLNLPEELDIDELIDNGFKFMIENHHTDQQFYNELNVQLGQRGITKIGRKGIITKIKETFPYLVYLYTFSQT